MVNMTFEGRRVYDINGYPAVTWKEHPACSSDSGYAYVHRIVAYSLWSDAVFGMHVHHKDGDRYNLEPGNLELLTPGEHVRSHLGRSVALMCPTCWTWFPVVASDADNRKTCSVSCIATKVMYPPTSELLKMVEETSYTEVGRRLGVSDNAVRKRIRNH